MLTSKDSYAQPKPEEGKPAWSNAQELSDVNCMFHSRIHRNGPLTGICSCSPSQFHAGARPGQHFTKAILTSNRRKELRGPSWPRPLALC